MVDGTGVESAATALGVRPLATATTLIASAVLLVAARAVPLSLLASGHPGVLGQLEDGGVVGGEDGGDGHGAGLSLAARRAGSSTRTLSALLNEL